MLIACTPDRRRVSLAGYRWSREALRRMEKQSGFYCPVCHGSVMLKIGATRCWHFAHLPHQPCSIDHEPETMAHISGKSDLLAWCAESEREARLEHYLPELRQRPDLYLPGIAPAVIEYQCSAIPGHVLTARSQGYLHAGITPVWLFGTEHHHRRGSSVRLSEFVAAAIRQSIGPPVQHPFASSYFVCFYNPTVRQVYYVHTLLPQSKTHFISQENRLDLSSCRPYQLFRPPAHFSPELFKRFWLDAKRKKRLAVPNHLSAEEQKLRIFMYRARLHFASFPACVGLPHQSFIHFLHPPIIWQLWIYLLLTGVGNGRFLTVRRLMDRTRNFGMAALIKRRTLPLCGKRTAEQLITIYMKQLLRLHVAEERNGGYRICCPPSPALPLAALLEQDRAVLFRLEAALMANPIQE